MNKIKKYSKFLRKHRWFFIVVLVAGVLIYDLIVDYPNYRTRDFIRFSFLLLACIVYAIAEEWDGKDDLEG